MLKPALIKNKTKISSSNCIVCTDYPLTGGITNKAKNSFYYKY